MSSTLLALFLWGCGDDATIEAPADPHAVFELPRGEEHAFFDLPWPTDVRRTADGNVDLRDFPNPRRLRILTRYFEAISGRVDGWATNSPVYFRFSEAIDETTLPVDGAASLAGAASAFIIDVDPTSPSLGRRHPAITHYRDEATEYWPVHTLAVRPVYGIPLASARTYAAVVTRSLLRSDGGTFERTSDLADVLGDGGDDVVASARELYGPAVEVIESSGIAREEILSLAVFTTQDPTSELIGMRDWMMESYTEPTAVDSAWRWVGETGDYNRLEGAYGPVPVFQNGEMTYMSEGSGEIRFAVGAPVVDHEFDARFVLTVPKTPMPVTGYPLVLYAHGTYGDYASFVRNGVAERLASMGYAAMGIDQIFHGERNRTGLASDILFFNFINPFAARDNNRQAVLDVVQQARAAKTLQVPDRILAGDGSPIHFDANRRYVFGHSQGGLNMPIFLSIDDQTQGGMLSGSGAILAISIVEKKEPDTVPTAIKLFLALEGSTAEIALAHEHFVTEHPVVTVLQTWMEVADPANYAQGIFHDPRPGFAPKSVLISEGLMDRAAPPRSIEALAAVARAPLIRPVERPIEALTLQGLEPVSGPVTANVAGGAATAGIIQYDPGDHYIAFTNADAANVVDGFFDSFEGGPPTIR